MRELQRTEMIEDLRFVTDTIEHVHSDPFLRCGGRVAFFTRVREIGRALPQRMCLVDFGVEVGKVTAVLEDGHTTAFGFDGPAEHEPQFGVSFAVVGADLVLTGTQHAEAVAQLGARLRSVNGTPVAALLDRLGQLVGAENEVALATGLAYRLRSPRWIGLLTQHDAAAPSMITLGLISRATHRWR